MLQKTSSLLVASVAFASLATACSSGIAHKRQNPFPKPEKIQKYASKPLPKDVLQITGVSASEWTFSDEELPDTIGATQLIADDDWDRDLITALSGGSTRAIATAQMDCWSREAGRFILERGDTPDAILKEYMANRCGTTSTSRYTTTWTFDKDDPSDVVSRERMRPGFFDDVAKSIQKTAQADGYREFGIWFGQNDERAILVVGTGYRKASIEAMPMTLDGKLAVTITGRLLVPAAHIAASITQGDFGYEACAIDSTVELPAFRVLCPAKAGDEKAVFSIASSKVGERMQARAFSQMVWIDGPPTKTYSPSPIKQMLSSHTPEGAGDVYEQYLQYANLVRAEAGLQPLSLSKTQCETATRITPFIFEAMRDDDAKMRDELSHGLMAGWDVPGDIVDGDIMLTKSLGGSPAKLLAEVLEGPSGRSTVLSPEGGTLAVGHIAEGGSIGASLTVYEYMEEKEHIQRVKQVWRTVNRARTLDGQPKIKRSGRLKPYAATLAQKVYENKVELDTAANRLASKTADSYNSGVRYFTYLVHDLDDIPVHPSILKAKKATAVVMVAPYRADGYPWVTYGVVLVIPNSKMIVADGNSDSDNMFSGASDNLPNRARLISSGFIPSRD